MKSFIISILLVLSISSANAQYRENRVGASSQTEEVPLHVKKMQERAEAIRQAQVKQLESESVPVEETKPVEIIQQIQTQSEVVKEPEQISHREIQKVPDVVKPTEVVRQTPSDPVKASKYSDNEIKWMVGAGIMLAMFIGSLTFHIYSTYFVNLLDFTLTTMLSILAFLYFKENSLAVLGGVFLVNLIAGLVINKSIPKAFVSMMGRVSGMIGFLLAVIAGLFWAIIHKVDITDRDSEDDIRRKKAVMRSANITGVAVGGSVTYLVYKYFIDNTNVEKYAEAEE